MAECCSEPARWRVSLKKVTIVRREPPCTGFQCRLLQLGLMRRQPDEVRHRQNNNPMTTKPACEPPRIGREDPVHENAMPSKFLSTRKVLWLHVATVSCLTVLLYRAGGDLHSIQPPALFVLVTPVIFSVFLFPPLTVYTLIRDGRFGLLSLMAECILTFLHSLVLAMGFASY